MLNQLDQLDQLAYVPLSWRKGGAMGKPVNIYDAKTRLSELVDQAAAGKEIVIAKAGRPVARLVPLKAVGGGRRPGRWAGRMSIADDFDAPLPDATVGDFEGEG